MELNEEKMLEQVEQDKQAALAQQKNTYDEAISQADSFYQQQADAARQWGEEQIRLQQEQTDFAIEQLQQQKDQAQKDYLKEQSGAYRDWQKQSNAYGAEAEKVAAAGLGGSGYSESSQVSMYTAYQNRVAAARDSLGRAKLEYDNAMKEARLQNNAALAEIAYKSLQQQLELSLSGFQYRNQLLLDQQEKQQALESDYWNRYMDVADQIRQDKELERLVQKDKNDYEMDLANLELSKQKLEEDKRQFQLTLSESGKALIDDDDKDKTGGVTIEEANADSAGDNAYVKNIMALGYGWLTPEQLAEKIASGEVIINADGSFSRKKTSAVKKATDKFKMEAIGDTSAKKTLDGIVSNNSSVTKMLNDAVRNGQKTTGITTPAKKGKGEKIKQNAKILMEENGLI